MEKIKLSVSEMVKRALLSSNLAVRTINISYLSALLLYKSIINNVSSKKHLTSNFLVRVSKDPIYKSIVSKANRRYI